MTTISSQEFLKGGKPVLVQGINTKTNDLVGLEKSVFGRIKEVGVGFAKGAGSSLQGLQDIGQRGLAAIDPTQNLDEIRQTTGIKRLSEADFRAKTTEEKVGKTLEFIAEVLFPVGKAGGLAKGKNLVTGGLDNLAEKASTLSDNVVEGGVKVKDKVIELASKLDEKTKTALQRTPREVFDKFVEQGRKAVVDDRVRTPLEAVGDSVIKGLEDVKKLASQVGEKKSSFIKYPEAFKGDGLKTFKEQLNSFLNSRSLIENDKPLINSIKSEFAKLGESPSKGQVDKFIDFAQEKLFAGEKNLVLPTSNKTTAGLKSILRKLNESLKNQLPEEYRTLNDQYRELADLSSELNKKLGKKGSSAGSLVKRLFSPSDARTKELFDELQRITGQDYARDARLAKFVMDALGDVRAESLLEQVPTSKGQVVDKVINFIMEKTGIKDPIKAAERFLEQQSLPK